MKKEYKYASIFFVIIAVGVISISYFYDEVDLKRNTNNNIDIDDKKFLRISPKLQGISGYINTSSDQINQEVEGNVVFMIFGHTVVSIVSELYHTLQHGMKNTEMKDW